jgi:hypothetical protein
MAHFAQVTDGIVQQVIVADTAEWCEANLGGTWVQTSYNTHANQHPEGRPLHKNYAGIGYTWDGTGFSAPKPYNSWTLDTETYLWNAPTLMPVEEGKFFTWDEPTLSWVEVVLPTE